MKEEKLKNVLIISSLPFIYILIRGFYSLIFGANSFFGEQVYGIEAFILDVTLLSVFLGPLLLICLAYQLFYLTRHFIKKNNVGEDSNIDPPKQN